ncbi:type II secretion system protein [Candidatus Falkowbacteria bacterium]|nr:type II secretion system protein [Candidatus Falkowbacteria bacterium]
MRGFTIIELLVVLAIFLVIVAIFMPLAISFYQMEILNRTEGQLVWLLREARDSAINQKNNSYFGVKITDDNFILFRGINFDNRVSADDQTVAYSNSIKISGDNEIVFTPSTGFITNEAIIKLSSAGVVREININKIGIINY